MTKKSEFNFSSIYGIKNKITNTIYVGQAQNTRIRWATHRRTLQRNLNTKNQYLQRAWDKYGEENFVFEVLFQLLPATREETDRFLDRAEIDILYDHRDNCYNLMQAGISGLVASEETIKKLSEHNKRQWQNPEHRAKISAAQRAAWNEPGKKEARIAQYREAFKKPEYKKRRKEISKQFWEPGGCLRETQSAKRKANWQNPEYIAKQKSSRKAAWQNPEIRAKRIAAIKAAKLKRKQEKQNS